MRRVKTEHSNVYEARRRADIAISRAALVVAWPETPDLQTDTERWYREQIFKRLK